MTSLILPSFSKDTPNKIGKGIDVSGKNTLIKTGRNGYRVAIANEPIDAQFDGKKMFCVRVDNSGGPHYTHIMIGFTPLETFHSKSEAYFGENGFTGCGMSLNEGDLCYLGTQCHDIIDWEISKKAKETIAILTISNSGKKKEIRFLCDGKESQSSDVSEILKGDLLFPAICLCERNQQVTTIPIDQIKTRTPEIENLIKEYQQQRKNHISIEEVKQARHGLLKQNEQMMSDFFKQFEQQVNASDVVEVATKKENKKEKKVKQVATKKTKKEPKPKTTKATKKKEETKNNKKEQKTKANKQK
jgi:hypothetical protein